MTPSLEVSKFAMTPAPPVGKPSRSGIALAIMGAAVVASSFESARVAVGPLLVHPYVFMLPPLLLLYGDRLKVIPRPIVSGSILFSTAFLLASLPSGGSLGESIKIVASLLTMVVVSVLVVRRADFIVGVTGLALAAAGIALLGFVGATEGLEFNPLEGIGNKNAYSLYSLPAFLLAMTLVVDRRLSNTTRIVLGLASLTIVLATFGGANRSGWFGVGVAVLLTLSRGVSVRTLMVLSVLAVATGVALDSVVSTAGMEQRIADMEVGHTADNLRLELIVSAFEIGLENPLMGVSPQQLPYELAKRVTIDMDIIDPHNFIAWLVGGTGLLGTASFVFLAVALWRASRKKPWTEGGWLLRSMMVLWLVRGQFSREIIAAPGFSIGLGLALGLMFVERREQVDTANQMVHTGN